MHAQMVRSCPKQRLKRGGSVGKQQILHHPFLPRHTARHVQCLCAETCRTTHADMIQAAEFLLRRLRRLQPPLLGFIVFMSEESTVLH